MLVGRNYETEILDTLLAAAGTSQSAVLRVGVSHRAGGDAVEVVTAEAIRRGQGLGVPIGQYALTLLELGQARYEDARISALKVFAADPL